MPVLSDLKIRQAKPLERQYKLFDTLGLYLLIKPTGSRGWRFRYSFEGREKCISFGLYPRVSLKQARAARDAALAELARGLDPSAERKRVKACASLVAASVFERVALDWFERNSPLWAPRYARVIESRLNRFILPRFGKTPIADLKIRDFAAHLGEIAARGTAETARRVGNIISQITRHACACGLCDYDAGASLGRIIPRGRERHYAAVIEPKQLGRLLVAIDACQAMPSVWLALRILPYVFVRSSELRLALWSEVNLEEAVWIIPAARMKNRLDHVVPLAPQVAALFCEMRKFAPTGDFVFPGYGKGGPISEGALRQALGRIGFGKGVMTTHGFRSSASTLLNEMGFRSDLIEAQLSHVERNRVRAAYNRAQWLPERRELMQAWASYLDQLRAEARGANGG